MKSTVLIAILVFSTSALAMTAKKSQPSREVASTLVVRPCDDNTPASLESYVEHKFYSNNAIRVFSVDTNGEPVCCSSHLVIYMADRNEPSNKCFHIASSAEGYGVSGINLSRASTSYNARTGLTLDLPVLFYNPEGSSKEKRFKLIMNQATQTITVK